MELFSLPCYFTFLPPPPFPESREENDYIKNRLIKGGIRYTWTSGRKCNFDGCDRQDLQPVIVNGWFWAGSGARLGPSDRRSLGDWGPTGGADKPQPDNREGTEPRVSPQKDIIVPRDNDM